MTIRLNSTWKLVTLAAKKKWHKSEGLYLNLFKSNCLKHGKLKRHFVFTITPFWNNSFLFCLIKPEAKIRIIFLAEMTLAKLRNTTFLSNPFLYHPHLHSTFVDLYVKLYAPSTLNIDLILWHRQLIVCSENVKSWVFLFTFQAYILPHTLNFMSVSLSKFHIWILEQF